MAGTGHSDSCSSSGIGLHQQQQRFENENKNSPVATDCDIDPALEQALFPDVSFVGRTYWADLPFRQRVRWVNQQSNQETRRELSRIWNQIKTDPLLPFIDYWHNYALVGMGICLEGYVLFSIGNVKPLFEAAWPQCWSDATVCSQGWISAVSYLQIIGIICGQIGVGLIGDWVGRRWGLVQDAVVMFLGSILLLSSWGQNLNGWVIMYAWSLFVFGFGVGGEYPMTSTRAIESRQSDPRADRLHRGRNVILAFLMQGWGQLLNQVVLIVLLLIFNNHGGPPYSTGHVQPIFRLSFAFVAPPLLWLAYYRFFRVGYASKALNQLKRRGNVTGYDTQSLGLVGTHYWHRLIATAGGWFCNDFFFYGNKIFQGVFISIISPNSDSVMTTWLWNLVNIACELAGYYLAAFLIDHRFYGRKRMQAVGFLMNFILFIISAAKFEELQKPGAAIHAFQFIFFMSSFFNQFGANCTTFLVAAEVYPTSVRGTAHGLSAAIGKCGALIPGILYNYVSNRAKFWIVTWFGLLGLACTLVFLPDTTGLDLAESERYFALIREGRGHEYHGIAVHSRHLSWYERRVLGLQRQYDPELDAKQRIAFWREEYQRIKLSDDTETASELSDQVITYFDRVSGKGY